MSIQVAKASDVKHIADLVMSLSHYYLPPQDLTPDATLPSWLLNSLTEEQFLQRLNSSDYKNYIYIVDEAIVGYISMKEGHHLYHLFVTESHQGKGIANKLWKHTCEQCPAEKYTLRSSLYAVPVYKKWGFIETDSVKEKDGLKFQSMELVINK